MNKQRFVIPLILTYIFGCFSFISMATQSELIAEVNGKPIYSESVWQSDALIKLMHPDTPGDEFETLKLQNAQRNLANLIMQILRSDAMDQFEITISSEEVDAMLDRHLETMQKDKPLEELVKELQSIHVLFDALAALQDEPEAVDRLYTEMLEPAGFDESIWRFYATAYGTSPDRIQEMRDQIPKSVEDLILTTRNGIERELKTTALNQKIEQVAEGAPETKVAIYWLRKLEAAEIKIYDDRLDDIVEKMLKNYAL